GEHHVDRVGRGGGEHDRPGGQRVDRWHRHSPRLSNARSPSDSRWPAFLRHSRDRDEAMNLTTRAAAFVVALMLGFGADVAAQAPARAPPATPSQAAPAPAARRFDPITAPTGQEMIRALIALQATPLARLTRCAGKGVSETDVDVGDFLA